MPLYYGILPVAQLPSRAVVVPFRAVGQSVTWTDMPLALTEFLGGQQNRTKFDLTNFTQARLTSRSVAAGAAGAELRVQWSTDEAAWSYLDGSAGPAVSAASANTTQVSGWVNLEAGARADVFLRLVGITGDGAADPSFGNIILQVR